MRAQYDLPTPSLVELVKMIVHAQDWHGGRVPCSVSLAPADYERFSDEMSPYTIGGDTWFVLGVPIVPGKDTQSGALVQWELDET